MLHQAHEQSADFALRSEEAQDLLTQPPQWILRWGLTVLLLICAGALALSYFIRYPSLVEAPFRLSSSSYPKPVITRISGRLNCLFVQPNQQVTAGQQLAYLENTADFANVQALAHWLSAINASPRQSWHELAPPPETIVNLGELQPAFATFMAAYSTYQQFGPRGLYARKTALLQADLLTLKQLQRNLQSRQHLANQDLALERDNHQVQRTLFDKKVIPYAELKQADSKLIAKDMSAEEMKALLLANTAAQLDKQREILEFQHLIHEQEGVFQRAVQTMTSAMALWREKYCLYAPAAGRVVFSSFWQANQPVTANQELFLLLTPPGEQYGEVSLRQQNFGRLRVGNNVLIKFDSYPVQEFGLVTGRVVYISDVPGKNGAFLAKVELPHGLKTNYGNLLTYRDGMTAHAQIVADDTRLIEKIFFSFRQALNR